jgi:hypothetical protein
VARGRGGDAGARLRLQLLHQARRPLDLASGGPARARIADPAAATRYRFGTGTADFHVCRACGAVPAVTSVIEGRTYAVVNVNCLEGVDPATLDRVATDFEGEAVGDRLGRRRARWIAEVATEAGPD